MLYDDDITSTYTRVELTMHIAWIAENPELYKAAHFRFFEENKDMEITSRATKGTITLIAKVTP